MGARFGPAGNSNSFEAAGYKSTLDAPAFCASMGLDAYEYQCGNSDSNFSFNPWYVQINAVISRAKGNGNNPANVVAKYAHKTVSLGSIGVSISPGIISFSASGAATYDTASPVSTVVYY